MSYPIMPTLPISMGKGLKKSPAFNNAVQRVAADRGNAAISFKPYPTWNFEFDMDRITGNEAAASSVLAQFMGTLMVCNGSAPLETVLVRSFNWLALLAVSLGMSYRTRTVLQP